MKNSNIGSIAKDLVEKNQQGMYEPTDLPELDIDCDWKLSYTISKFLTKEINFLPNIETTMNIINEAKEAKRLFVSVGCGIVVRFDKDGFVVECIEPINSVIDRKDVISSTKYYAVTMSTVIRSINVKQYPRFEEGRVRFLQDYISKCNELYETKQTENTNQELDPQGPKTI